MSSLWSQTPPDTQNSGSKTVLIPNNNGDHWSMFPCDRISWMTFPFAHIPVVLRRKKYLSPSPLLLKNWIMAWEEGQVVRICPNFFELILLSLPKVRSQSCDTSRRCQSAFLLSPHVQVYMLFRFLGFSIAGDYCVGQKCNVFWIWSLVTRSLKELVT